jgi:hypothetical protein
MSKSEEDLQKAIFSQGQQMITLIDISNATSNENDNLKKEIASLRLQGNEAKDLFYLQTLLFVLLLLIVIWLCHCNRNK